MIVGFDVRKQYTTTIKSTVVSDEEKARHEAQIKKSQEMAKQASIRIKAKMARRDANRIFKDNVKPETLKSAISGVKQGGKDQILAIEEEAKNRETMIEESKEELIEQSVKEALGKTNHLARAFGLAEPNNPEALKHDRLHCSVCDMRLHWPNAYKDAPEEAQMLLGKDEDVRHICCYCFGKLESGQDLEIQKGEATKEIRMMVYNPREFAERDLEGKLEEEKAEIRAQMQKQKEHTQQMTKERLMYIRSKIKRLNGISMLEEPKKYNSIDGEDTVVNGFLNSYKSRYNSAEGA